MQCNALSLPFGVGKNSSWVRVYNMAAEREREKERQFREMEVFV